MRGTSPILITAALSIAVLFAAVGMHLAHGREEILVDAAEMVPVESRAYLEIEDANGNGIPDWQDELQHSGIAISTSTEEVATSTDPVADMGQYVASALYGGYLSLKKSGGYSPTSGESLAMNVASNIRAPETFTPHTVEELSIKDAASHEGTLAYRDDMRDALLPLVSEDPPEFETYALYIETKDPVWLQKLADAATRYRAAEKNALTVAVPKDAAPEHLRVINALGEYAETLERLSKYGTDALASVALFKSMNENEEEMLRSFDLLAQYYVRSTTN